MFSTRKGHPALRARHAKFPIDKKAAGICSAIVNNYPVDRWLVHMKAALQAISIPEDSFNRIWPFFEHVANFLINTQLEEESESSEEEKKPEVQQSASVC